jgi:DNA-binding transcriptional ArsR family regulator
MRHNIAMPSSVPVLADALPQTALHLARPSLAAAVPTAMLLVDYALNRQTMPIPELIALADGLREDLVEASWPVRASMAHGTVLRSALVHQLPADHPGHTEWPELRQWIAGRTDAQINGLIDFGCDAVMNYAGPPRDPEPTGAEIAPQDEPTAAVRRDGPQVLRAWGVPRAAERASELLDPAGFRDTLLALLDAIWDGWLGAVWSSQLPALEAAVQSAPAPPTGCTPTQWVTLVTGLRPDPSYAEAAEQASELIVMPVPGLGRSLSLFTDQQTWVLFSPQGAVASKSADRTGISIGRLGQLAPAMTALGDRTRLAIVLQLLDEGPQTMQGLADSLEVHQSTISRQVGLLRRAGLVVVRDRKVHIDRSALRTVGETLLATLD